ncbi:hypothetical protein QP118_14715, partial [Enterococcus faecalis]
EQLRLNSLKLSLAFGRAKEGATAQLYQTLTHFTRGGPYLRGSIHDEVKSRLRYLAREQAPDKAGTLFRSRRGVGDSDTQAA